MHQFVVGQETPAKDDSYDTLVEETNVGRLPLTTSSRFASLRPVEVMGDS
jgi:hypothetical protein